MIELHTWNMVDGDKGLPKRPLSFRPGPLISGCVLAGGPGWDDDSESGDFLVVYLNSSRTGKQSSANYERFYDEYRPFTWYGAVVNKCDGGSQAIWAVEFRVKGMTPGQIDVMIKDVDAYHHKEIERLKNGET